MLLQQHGTNSTDTLTSQDVIEAPIDVGSLNIFEDHLDLLSNSESLAQYTVTPASSRRLLIGLGAYPTNYNTSLDSDYIFTSAQLYSMHGQNYSECLLSQKAAANFSICESCTALYSNGSVSSHDVSKVTRPYPFLGDLGASAVSPSAAVFDGPQTALTIQCGLNPMYTNNVTNDDLNSLPWSWDNAMPVNGSLDCAVMSSAAAGRWRVSDCNRVLSIACQSNSNPLQVRLDLSRCNWVFLLNYTSGLFRPVLWPLPMVTLHVHLATLSVFLVLPNKIRHSERPRC